MEKCFKDVSLGKGFWLLFYRSPNLLDIKAEYPDKITSNGKMSAQQRNLSTDKHWVGGRVCKYMSDKVLESRIYKELHEPKMHK